MSWVSLYVKELRLTRTKFIINIVFLLMVAALILFLMERYNPLFIMLTIPLIIVHFFYMFFAMFDSLRQEWKQKTSVFWLNIPRSGWSLLTAKYVAAMSQLFVSLTVTFIIIYFLLQRSIGKFPDPTVPNFLMEQFASFWWILFFGIFIASLQAGTVSTFIYLMAKSIRKWGWILGIVIIASASWLWGKVQETGVYQALTEWGVILNGETVMNSVFIHFDDFANDPNMDMGVTNEAVLYLGSVVGDLLIIAVVLYASAWLIDRFVES